MKILQIIGGIALAGVLGLVIFNGSGSSSGSSGKYTEYEDNGYEELGSIEDLAYNHWDEVREYMSGSETIEACSDSGCYSLDAEIADGYIEMLYFPNGGYIYPDAEIDEDGSAAGYDGDGNYWQFEVDLDSSTVQDAISDWAYEYREEYQDSSERDPRF